MTEHITITHRIQQYIINVLTYRQFARFSDLRPPRTDTNLSTYHLKSLMQSGLVDKTDLGYTLSKNGIKYVAQVSESGLTVRIQPKILIMLVIQNSDGDVLLQKRTKQPYIDAWTLPYGKLYIDDINIEAAARRGALEKLGLDDQPSVHAGDAYIRVRQNNDLLSSTLAHVFKFNHDDIKVSDNLIWIQPHKISKLRLAPAVEAIITRTFFNDDHFFEEFDENWYN